MNSSLFDAGGAPFSMLDAMKQTGGNVSPLKYYGGSKSSKKENKIIIEAWKCFKKDTKGIKDKVLKARIRNAEALLKRKIGGAEGEGESEVKTEAEAEVEAGAETEGVESNSDEVAKELRELKDKIANVEAGLDLVKIKVGINMDDDSAVKNALETVTKFINKKLESTEQEGGRRSKKHGGEAPGQYAINNIYAPEVGDGVTIGGRRSKKHGGEYASVNVDAASYGLLDTKQAGGRRSKKHGGEYAQVLPETASYDLLDAKQAGGRRSKKHGGNNDTLSSVLANPLADLQNNMLPKMGGTNGNIISNPIANPVAELQNMFPKSGGKKSKKKGGNTDALSSVLANPLAELQNNMLKTGGKRSKKKGGNLEFPGQLDAINSLSTANQVVTGAGSTTSHEATALNPTHTSLGGSRRSRR